LADTKASTKSKPNRSTSSKRTTKSPKVFVLPATLTAAKALGMHDADFNAAKTSIRRRTKVMIGTDNENVPVGHLWKHAMVNGDTMYACYKTSTGQCHWIYVSASNPPEWDPNPQ
jgi:hypothetical protein